MIQVTSCGLRVKLRWLFAVVLLIIAGGSCGMNNRELSVMTFNIRYDNPRDGENRWDVRKADLVELIERYQPAIFGIQEGMYHQVQYIDSSLTQYEYIGVGRDDGKLKGEFSALFYDTNKVSVSDEATFWLSETPDEVSVGWDASMERICTYGLFRDLKSKKELWVFNTHFDHRGPEARVNSAQLILSKIKEVDKLNLPVIFMGDLNAAPGSPPIEVLSAGLDDALMISDSTLEGPSGTFNGFNKDNPINTRIDYIFVSNLNVLAYRHIDDVRADAGFISDHLPVIIITK